MTGSGGLPPHAEALAKVLATVVHDADEAKQLATRAGFPVEHVPRFATAAGFWRDVVEAMVNGRGELAKLARHATDEYPGNSRLMALAEAIEALQTPPPEHAPPHPLLVEHREHLVRRLSPVKVLRNIADNEAGRGQSRIRLEDVFVCPRLVPEAVHEQLETYDRRLLDREPGQDRRAPALHGENVRWQPERWAASTMSVGQAFAKHRNLLVVGDPGSGKSTLLAALALATASEPLSQALAGGPSEVSLHGRIPLYLRLPQLASRASTEDVDLRRALIESLTVPAPAELVDHALRTDQALVLLDALDEVPSSAMRHRIADAIESFCSTHRQCLVVVTTREGGRTMIPGFGPVHLPPMTQEDTSRFISVWRKALGKTATFEIPAPDTVEALGELGRNPLMLLVMLLTGGLELAQRERVIFYHRALRTMLTTWRGSPDDANDPAVKQAWRAWGEVALGLRGDGSGGVLPRPALERLLRKALTEEGTTDAERLASLLVDDALRKSGLVIKRGDELAFWHSTFGEYLAATALACDVPLDRFLELRRDRRNVEVAVMTIDWLAHVAADDRAASERLRALMERRDPWDDVEGSQLAFAVQCLARGVHARPSEIDLCFLILLRLCRAYPYESRHHPTFVRLAIARSEHIPGDELVAELLRAVKDDQPPVALDVVVPMLARACDRSPEASEGCKLVLGRAQSSGIERAFAALGLVKARCLGEELLEALVELRWFSQERHYRSHHYDEDVVEPRADGGSFMWQLRRALGSHEQRLLSLWWSQEGSEAQRAALGLLLALSTEATDPQDTILATLLTAATSSAPEAVRENARGMLGRLALRHSRVRSALLAVALRPASDENAGRARHASEPGNWAQALLVRVVTTDPRGPTWLVDEVARAALSSVMEQRDDAALQLLDYLLHSIPNASSRVTEAVRRQRNDPALWPRLALCGLLLQQRAPGFRAPDQDLWLACMQSHDPWIRLTVLETWYSTWSSRDPSDVLITAFVDSCMTLLGLGHDESPPPDEALATLRRSEYDSLHNLSLHQKIENWLRLSLKRHSPIARRVAEALREWLSKAEPERATWIALTLAEQGHSGDFAEVADVLHDHALGTSDPDIQARSARWLATHGDPSRSPPTEALQWAMLSATRPPRRGEYADEIRRLGPPSDRLVQRMLELHESWKWEQVPGDWLHSNPSALARIIACMRNDEDPDRRSAAFNLLRARPSTEVVSNAIFEAARSSGPETIGWLTWLLHTRAEEDGRGGDPRLAELWPRVLTSEDPAMLARALIALDHGGWTGAHRGAVTKALRRCLSTDLHVVRLAAAWNILWIAKEHEPNASTLRDAISTLLGVMEIETQELVTSLEACLDDTSAEVRLLAVCFLIGLDAAAVPRQRVLQAIAQTDTTESYFFLALMSLNSGLSLVRLVEMILARTLPEVAMVIRLPAALPSHQEIAELLAWIVHDGALPRWIRECLRCLGAPRDESSSLTSRDPAHVAMALARSPLERVRAPALHAIADAIASRSERSSSVFNWAASLVADPRLADIVMEWAMTMSEQLHPRRVADEILVQTRSTAQVRRGVFEWLCKTVDASTMSGDSQRAERGARLMVQLVLGDGTHELRDELDAYLRSHWRELPLLPEHLLDLVRTIGDRDEGARIDVVWEIIERFLGGEDPEGRLDALDVWSRRPDRARGRVLALRAWRELMADGGFPCMEGACELALTLFEDDPTEADIIAYVRECARTPTLDMYFRIKALTAIDQVPSEREWAEALGLELLESVKDDQLRSVIDWFLLRWQEHALPPERLPFAVAKAIVVLATSGRSPSPYSGLGERWLHRHDPLPVDTPFDSLIARVLAEHLHEDPTTLRTAFDSARSSPGTLAIAESDVILRTVRARPTDDPTTSLARRWWHHQLDLPPSSDPLDRLP